jgi:hypothetical protein
MTERYSGASRLLITYAPIILSLVLVWNWVQIADDALITHRYVENFLANGEPYFNSGDRVLGLTSPGYFLMFSGISAIIPITIAYKLIAAAAYVLAGVALVHLFPSQKLAHRLVASVIFAATFTWHIGFLADSKRSSSPWQQLDACSQSEKVRQDYLYSVLVS